MVTDHYISERARKIVDDEYLQSRRSPREEAFWSGLEALAVVGAFLLLHKYLTSLMSVVVVAALSAVLSFADAHLKKRQREDGIKRVIEHLMGEPRE